MLPYLALKSCSKKGLNLKRCIKYHKQIPKNSAKIGCQKVMSCMRFYLFCPGDLVTCAGEREIRSVWGRLPVNPGELAWLL